MKRSLNILQLVNFRWYNACAHYALTLSSGLQKKGHRVILAGDKNSPPLQVAERMGLEIFPDLYLSYQNPGRFFYNLKRLKDVIGQEKIDLVNAHQGAGQLYSSLVRKLFKKKFVLIRTRGDQRRPRNNLFNKWLNLKWTDGIVTTAETLLQNYAENFPLDRSRLVNIPLGIDASYFSPQKKDPELRRSLGILNGEAVVGILGRLSPVKGHRYFIHAAAEVLRNFHAIKFLIAGEDAQVKSYRLRERVKEMGIQDKFIFVGLVEDPRKIISLMDIAVVASIGSETIARVALEYMALSKPVVGTDINAIPEVVKNGINGFIVRLEDSQGMAEAILKLLSDKDKREQFGKASRTLVENEFSLDTFVDKTEEFYFRFC